MLNLPIPVLFFSEPYRDFTREWQGKKKDLMAASKFASNLHQDWAWLTTKSSLVASHFACRVINKYVSFFQQKCAFDKRIGF